MYSVSFEILLKDEKAVKKLKDLEDKFKDIGKVGNVSISKINKETKNLEGNLGGALDILKVFGTALASGYIINSFIQISDAITNLKSSLRVAVDGFGELETAFNQVVDIANKTGNSIENVGNLYARLARSARDLVRDQNELAGVTETISMALTLSGGSAASTEAALIQLTQAFASGVLRGEEFNSVMEQAPRLAKALADGLGVSVGELRNLAMQGVLTSDIVIDAIKSQAKVIKAEYETIGPTVSRSMIKLKNSVYVVVDSFNKALGVTETLANAMDGLSSILDNVATGFENVSKNVKGLTFDVTITDILAGKPVVISGEDVKNIEMAQRVTEDFLKRVDELSKIDVNIVGEDRKKEIQKRLQELEGLLRETYETMETLNPEDRLFTSYKKLLDKRVEALKRVIGSLKNEIDISPQEPGKNLTEAQIKLLEKQFDNFVEKYKDKTQKAQKEINDFLNIATKLGFSVNDKQVISVIEAIKKKYGVYQKEIEKASIMVNKALSERLSLIKQEEIDVKNVRFEVEARKKLEEISFSEYLSQKRNLLIKERDLKKEAVLEDIRANQELLKVVSGEKEREAINNKIIELKKRLLEIESDYSLKIKDVSLQEELRVKEIEKQVKALEGKMSGDVENKTLEALKKMKKDAEDLGKKDLVLRIKTLIDFEESKDKLEKLKNKFESIIEELKNKKLVLEAKVQAGEITGAEAENIYRAQVEEAMPQLESLRNEINIVADSLGGLEEGKNILSQLDVQLLNVKTSVKSLGDVFQEYFADRFTSTIVDAINGVQSWGQAFRQMILMVLQEIQRLIVKMLVVKAIQAALGGIGIPSIGFATGGYTGPGGKYEPAGIVHKGEFVFSSEAVRNIGLDFLYGLHKLATGRQVNIRRVAFSYADGGFVNPPQTARTSVNIVNVLDYREIAQAIDSFEGENAILNVISRNSDKIRSLL